MKIRELFEEASGMGAGGIASVSNPAQTNPDAPGYGKRRKRIRTNTLRNTLNNNDRFFEGGIIKR